MVESGVFNLALAFEQPSYKDNLVQHRVLSSNDQTCTGGCGMNEDREHQFVTCDFYGKIRQVVCGWLGFSTAVQGKLMGHLDQFSGL